jgi:hypothetical protein
MSYTVTEAYHRILEEADKLGSDYFSLPQVLKAFKKETLSFVGARAKEAEINQEVTDDIRSLLVPTLLPFIPNPDNALEKMATLPNNYHTKISVNVLYTDGLKARVPTLERHGEHNTNSISPFKKPDRMYPLIQQFSNYFNVHTGLTANSTVQPSKLILIYIKQPSFGVAQTDVMVDLPDSVCEYLFAETANHLRLNTGEPQASQDFQANQTFRNK